MIFCFGSGGLFNPVITLGYTLARVLSIRQALCYFFAQMIGGIVGAALVRVCRFKLRIYYFSIFTTAFNIVFMHEQLQF